MNVGTQWLLLVATLPTRPAAARMRLWRSLKALGCAALRDGAYLMPEGSAAGELSRLAEEAITAGGSAELLRIDGVEESQAARFRALFDRAADYARLMKLADEVIDERTARTLRREYAAIAAIDFFPGEAKRQAEAALGALEARLGGEPVAAAETVRRCERKDYGGRTWATRKRIWVDRMASVWLIRRFIDADAKFLWLDDAGRCPNWAVGFDFDGAEFTHSRSRVTFENLVAAFGLDSDPALARVGALVHALDVGGVPVAEAPGVEAMLAGLRATEADDDRLSAEASRVFDWLLQFYAEKDHG